MFGKGKETAAMQANKFLFLLFHRKRLQHGILSALHAKTKQDVVDGPGSRLSEIMRFGFPGS